MVADVFYIHFTGVYAQSAVHALLFVEPDAYKREFIEETVYRTERADETAEKSVKEDTKYYENNQQRELPGEQIAERVVEIAVTGVRQQR